MGRGYIVFLPEKSGIDTLKNSTYNNKHNMMPALIQETHQINFLFGDFFAFVHNLGVVSYYCSYQTADAQLLLIDLLLLCCLCSLV